MSEMTQTLTDDASAQSQSESLITARDLRSVFGAPLRCKARGIMNASSIWAMPSPCHLR